MKHKASVTNRVIDALSGRNSLLSTIRIEVSSFDSFCDLLDTNPYFSSIMTIVRIGERTDFLLHDDFLLKDN